jgi:hypothetical protein
MSLRDDIFGHLPELPDGIREIVPGLPADRLAGGWTPGAPPHVTAKSRAAEWAESLAPAGASLTAPAREGVPVRLGKNARFPVPGSTRRAV